MLMPSRGKGTAFQLVGNGDGMAAFRVPGGDGVAARCLTRAGRSSAAAQLGEQAQDLEIKPDQRARQAEPALPLHELRGSLLHPAFDEVEVEDEVQSRDDYHDRAEADAARAALVDE